LFSSVSGWIQVQKWGYFLSASPTIFGFFECLKKYENDHFWPLIIKGVGSVLRIYFQEIAMQSTSRVSYDTALKHLGQTLYF